MVRIVMPAKKAAAKPNHLDEVGFEHVIGPCSDDIAAVARAARKLVIDVLPAVHEIVWRQQRNIGYGTGPKKQSEHFCWISPASKHVSIGFNYGAELPDPKALLEGTGKLFRHVKLMSLDDVNQPALRTLVRAATKHRVPQR
jgi:hypothetical protein